MKTVNDGIGEQTAVGIEPEADGFFARLLYMKLYPGSAFPDAPGPNGTTAVGEGVKTKTEFIF